MSKLIDLIGRLGQQSAQPIGFGALTGRVEAAPTMALIASASASESGPDLGVGIPDSVDAIVFSDPEAKTTLDLVESGVPEGLVWGVNGGSLSVDDLEALIEAGCDYVLVETTSPANVVGQADVGVIVVAAGPVDRQTGAALRSLRVDGSLNTSGVGSDSLSFGALVEVVKVGASVGGVMLVTANDAMSTTDLTALREAGVDGLVAPLAEKQLVSQLAESIRALPPRRRPEARGLSVTAPRGDS